MIVKTKYIYIYKIHNVVNFLLINFLKTKRKITQNLQNYYEIPLRNSIIEKLALSLKLNEGTSADQLKQRKTSNIL